MSDRRSNLERAKEALSAAKWEHQVCMGERYVKVEVHSTTCLYWPGSDVYSIIQCHGKRLNGRSLDKFMRALEGVTEIKVLSDRFLSRMTSA